MGVSNEWRGVIIARSLDGATVFIGSEGERRQMTGTQDWMWFGSVYAIHASDGTQKWAFQTGGEVYSSPALSSDDATVFVGSNDKKVYALHANNGTQKWSFETGGGVRFSLALSSDGTTTTPTPSTTTTATPTNSVLDANASLLSIPYLSVMVIPVISLLLMLCVRNSIYSSSNVFDNIFCLVGSIVLCELVNPELFCNELEMNQCVNILRE